MQFGENRLRLRLEPVQKPESPEHHLGRFRGLACRERAFGLEAIAGLEAQLCHAHGRSTSHGKQDEPDKRQHRHRHNAQRELRAIAHTTNHQSAT